MAGITESRQVVSRAQAMNNFARKFMSLSWYAIRRRILFLLLVLVAGAAVIIMLFGNWQPMTEGVEAWRVKAQPIIGATTFLVAVGLWFQQLRKSWHESLPNRLTVVFRYGKSEVFRCERAYLPDPSSIREFAQQIGAHMPNPRRSRRLAFCVPLIELERPERIYDQREKRVIEHYQAAFELMELPDDVKEGQSWCWTYPFTENDVTDVGNARETITQPI